MAPSCPRIIFLIDRSQFTDPKYALYVHLAALRILVYYAHNSSSQEPKNGVLWGYKFFNSLKQEQKYGCKRYPFLDFTTQHFDVFEKELYSIQTDNDGCSVDLNNFGQNLRITLTDLLADFHWERPELLSPSKKGQALDSIEDVSNFVYLFTLAPRDSELDQYFKLKKKCNKNKLLEKFIPKSLYIKFVRELRIKLNWVESRTFKHTEKLFESSLLKNCLESIDGNLLSLRTITYWWLHNEDVGDKKFADLLSTSCLTKGTKTFPYQEPSNIFTEYTFTINLDNGNSSKILLCPVGSSSYKQCEEVNRNIIFNGVVAKDKLDPRSFTSQQAFFYTFALTDVEDKFTFLINSTIIQNQVMKITWRSSDVAADIDSVLIPCTHKFGIILPMAFESTDQKTIITRNGITESQLSSEDCAAEDENEDPLSLVLKTKITNWEFGTALVNCIDNWFMYNPNLGFKYAARNIFRKLYKGQIIQNERREENCKQQLLILEKKQKKAKDEAEKLKKEKEKEEEEKQQMNLQSSQQTQQQSNEKQKSKKKTKSRRLKGMSWVRWRLQEYTQRQKEKQHSENPEDKEEKKEEAKEIIELPPPLPVEEFKSQEEMKRYLQLEWESLESAELLKHRLVERFVMTPIQFFSSIDENSCQEVSINLLKGLFIKKLKEIRQECEDKEQEIKTRKCLLQVHLLMECGTAMQGHPVVANDEDDNTCDQIVTFLRALIFEESIEFVRNHLKKNFFPYFVERNKELLLDIYEEMMFEIPPSLEDFQKERDKKLNGGETDEEDERSPSPRSILLPSSLTSETSSVCSQQSDRRNTLRRIPSSAISDNSQHKKMISVIPSTSRSLTRSSSNRKLSRRSTSSKQLNNKSTSAQPAAPKTPTLKRRHSEILHRQRVPETPEGRQRNDLIWKKQELNRRVSKVDIRMKPIEESPLKDLTSPVKIPTSLLRSNSFSMATRSSPRKFYAVRRLTSSQTKESESESKEECPEKPRQNIKSILFSNFQSPTSKSVFPPEEKTDNDTTKHELKRSQKTRRNIFSSRSLSEASGADTLSFESTDVTCFSPPRERACKRLRLSISDDNTTSSQTKLPLSDNTMDWLSEIEQNGNNQNNTEDVTTPSLNLSFREAFEELNKQTPDSNTSPSFLKKPFGAMNETVKQSPTIVRAGNEKITVSPLLSVSSIEMLESAPILSPVSKRKKSKNRRTLTMD